MANEQVETVVGTHLWHARIQSGSFGRVILIWTAGRNIMQATKLARSYMHRNKAELDHPDTFVESVTYQGSIDIA